MTLQGLKVGVLKETMPRERRVAASPETAARMKAAGARVWIETGAGEGSLFADSEYTGAGGEVVSREAVLEAAEVILKVKEPRRNEETGQHEADLFRPGQCLVCFLHPGSPANRSLVTRLAERKVTALTLDGIPRIARAQAMDALTSMSMIAGYKGFLMAADILPKFIPLVGTGVGVVPPATVWVVGAGVAGLQSLAMGKRLGARVTATDIRPEAREQAGSLGAEVIDPGVPVEWAADANGYARALPEEWLEREREALQKPLAAADMVILSALVPGRAAPLLVTDEALSTMRPGSVVVDIAIDQGGNCAATEVGRVVVRHGVHVIGMANIPGQVPVTATWMFARNILQFLEFLAPEGRIDLDREDEILAGTLVTREGRVLHAGAREAMDAVSKGAGS